MMINLMKLKKMVIIALIFKRIHHNINLMKLKKLSKHTNFKTPLSLPVTLKQFITFENNSSKQSLFPFLLA